MKRISKEIYFWLEGLFASLFGELEGKLRTWNLKSQDFIDEPIDEWQS